MSTADDGIDYGPHRIRSTAKSAPQVTQSTLPPVTYCIKHNVSFGAAFCPFCERESAPQVETSEPEKAVSDGQVATPRDASLPPATADTPSLEGRWSGDPAPAAGPTADYDEKVINARDLPWASQTPDTDALDQGLYGYSDLARVLPRVFALSRDLERRLMIADCCRMKRPAKNLNAQVYYDAVYLSCKPGKGCKK